MISFRAHRDDLAAGAPGEDAALDGGAASPSCGGLAAWRFGVTARTAVGNASVGSWIERRAADSFISRGQVVHPGDVERVLLSHPAVADAGVAPVQRSGQEQVATAFVVLAPGAQATTQQELLAWCREHLTAHQVPAHVTFTGRLPRNSVGKLIRAGLQNVAGG